MNLSASPGCPLQYIVCNYAINARSLSPVVAQMDRAPPWAAVRAVLSSLLSCWSPHAGQTSIPRLFTCKGIIPFVQSSVLTGGNSFG